MARARAATRAGHYDEAIAAFDRAVRARPVDARARAERGFAYLQRGSTERAILDFDDGRVLSNERSLLAQLYLNLAEAYARLHSVEAERIALSLAVRRGSKEARARLGERSACPALWQAQLGPAGPIARSFMELVPERPLVGCDYHREKVATEAQARKYVCRGCAVRGEDAGDQCKGPGPWTIDSGYMSFQPFQFFVAPLPGGLFFHSARPDTPYRVQNRLLLVTEPHRNDLPLRLREPGSFIRGRFSSTSSNEVQVDDQMRWSDEESATSICDLRADGVDLGDFRGAPTLPAVTPEETTAYSLTTKHRLFTLAVYEGSVSLTIEGDTAVLRGEGCDAKITLPAEP